MEDIGYQYDELTDKWNISDMAADYIFCANKSVDFPLPGTLQVINNYEAWKQNSYKENVFPIFDEQQYLDANITKSKTMNFVMLDCYSRRISFI